MVAEDLMDMEVIPWKTEDSASHLWFLLWDHGSHPDIAGKISVDFQFPL